MRSVEFSCSGQILLFSVFRVSDVFVRDGGGMFVAKEGLTVDRGPEGRRSQCHAGP